MRPRISLKVHYLICLILPTPVLSQESPLVEKVILIDPGHGTLNLDSKIVNGGKQTKDETPEHFLTVQIAEKLREKLIDLGAQVILTRSSQTYWREAPNSVDDNKARAVLANELKADVLLSLHCDWHPKRHVKGITTLYTKSHSKSLATHVHKSLIRNLKTRDRKVKQDKFTILDHAEMPAILIETGFMSHGQEYKKLKSPKYQTKIAQAIINGLSRYFQN